MAEQEGSRWDELLARTDPIFRELLIAIIFNAQAAADRLGLHVTDLQAVKLLEVTGPLTAGELAQRIGLTTGAMTRLIDRLERAGYVCRARDDRDRRKVTVQLVTEQVHKAVEVFEPSYRHLAAALPDYGEQDLVFLLDFFTHATAGFHAATEEMREAGAGEGDQRSTKVD